MLRLAELQFILCLSCDCFSALICTWSHYLADTDRNNPFRSLPLTIWI